MSQLTSKTFGFICLCFLLCFMSFGQQTYSDTFSSVSYSQNNGTANFATNWIEQNETTDPSSGRITISSNQLRFNNLDGRWIYRDLDLSGATSVVLTLDWDATSRGNEGLYIYLWNNSTSNYDVIATINSTTTGSVNYNLNANQISANSRIAIGGVDSSWGGSETILLDNVLFTATFSAAITIADATVDEGAGTVTFTATHTGPNASGPFTVNYQTVDGTATAGSDYTANSGTLNFNGTSGDTEQITISITDDPTVEANETFTIQFTATSDGSVTITDTATGTITDNDSTIITDGTTTTTCSTTFFDSGGSGSNYGNNEDRTHTFCPSVPGNQIRLNFTSFDVENGYDFLYVYEGTTTGGTLIGQYHNGNLPPSTITSSDPSGCLTFRFTSDGSVTDPGWEIAVSCYTPAPGLTIDDVAVDEDAGTATFTVTHTGLDTAGPFTVNFTTTDGTATAGLDYTATSGTLSFNGTAGDTEQITVPILADMIVEGDETYTISFNTVSDPSVDITDTATGTINNNIGVDTPLTLFNEFNGYYDYAVTGGSLRDQDNNTNSCSITTSSSNTLTSTIPATATIERAYLFWVHSGATPDLDVTFEGQNVTATYADQTSFGSSVFYAMIGDVTTLVSGITDPSTNTFDFSGLTVDNGDPYCSSTVVVGGWTLFVFYSDDSLPAVSINLYQGFDGEQNNTQSFTLSGFYAIGASGAKTTVLSWEGDQTLANNELLSLTTTSGTTTLSGDGDNDGSTVNNPFNSTIFDNTVVPNVNNTTTYGLDLDTYDISSLISQGESSATTNVQVGQDYVMLNAVILKVPSNIIVGSVFEDVNYGGGAGRDMATAGGVGVEGARVELYDSGGTLQEFYNTDATGEYAFGGMANGDYSVRVVNGSVRSSRGGGSGCTTCLPIQTYRRNYTTLGGFVDFPNEVGGADPTATDVGNGVLANAQTVSTVTITADGVAGFDFGFNFNTIVNTNEDGQGSLEQFIINSNNLDETGLDIEANSIFDPPGGEDTSIFMIPPTGDALNRTADTNYASGYFDIFISNGNPLSNITAANTKIDGRTQTAYSGDSNSGTVGSGGSTVGVSANPLPNYELPEIQVHRNSGDVLITEGAGVTIRNISVYAGNNAGIRVDNGSATVSNNLLGVNAAGSNAGNIDDGVEVTGGTAVIEGNYIATTTDAGVMVDGGSSTIIQDNHITSIGDGACDDGITIVSGSGVAIRRNLIESAASLGIDGDGISGSVTITENTITTSGQDGGSCSGNLENAGILLDGSNSTISNNIIASNGGPGIVLAGGNTSGNLISQNSIYANGTASDALGIDLDATDNLGDGVTLNESGDTDNGPNGLLNFPVFESILIQGSNLELRGWARPGATIEIFLSDITQGTAAVGDNQLGLTQDYGEGQTYLASMTEGSGADLDGSSTIYTDADGNTDTTNRFEFVIPLPSGVTIADQITATATLGNSTSEFSSAYAVDARADLSLDKTVNNATPDVGTDITFTITVTNNGMGDTDNVEVTDLLPVGLDYVSHTASTGTYDDVTGVWNLGVTLNNGDSHTLDIVANVSGCSTMTNLAEITNSTKEDPDSTPNNGVDTDSDTNVEDDPDDEDDGDGVVISPVDVTSPVLASCPTDITVNNDAGSCGAVVTWTPPAATDNCGSVSLSTNNYNPGDTFLPGTTTVVYTATDGSGNSSSCSFTVTVIDNENPVISGPSDITTSADSGSCSAIVNYTAPSATDNCAMGDGTYPIFEDFEVADRNVLINECWQFFGTTVSTNNPLSGSTSMRTSNVISTESRSLISPLAYFNGAGQISFIHRIDQARNNNRITVSLVDEADVASIIFTEIYSNNSVQTEAVDINLTGNYRVRIDFDTDSNTPDRGRVDDLTIPALKVADTSGSGACPAANFQLVQTAGLASGAAFPVGTTTNTFEVTDAFGNTDTYSFDITVEDNEDPTASNPSPVTVYCSGDVPAPDVNVVTDEADNCTSPPTVSFISDVSSGGSPEVITRTYRITDASGNTTDVTQLITVENISVDTQPADQTVFVSNNASFSVTTTNADSYQWQVSTDGGGSFSNISDGAEYSGTGTLSLTVLSPEVDKNGYQYRVLVSNSSSGCPAVASSAAVLNVRVRTVISNRRITYRVSPN